jgi:hypothetical protein
MATSVGCFGRTVNPTPTDSGVAELRAFFSFMVNFKARFPNGIVLHELEFMAATTFAPLQPGPIQFPGGRLINAFLGTLTTDFRKWLKGRDFRKPDAMGIIEEGPSSILVELLEVTTIGRRQAAITQLRDKIDTLKTTVNLILNEQLQSSVGVNARATDWQPQSFEMQCPSSRGPDPNEIARWICFDPTFREPAAPPGVVLYEVHVLELLQQTMTAPDRNLKKEVVAKIKAAQRQFQTSEGPQAWWVPQFVAQEPTVSAEFQRLALIVGVAALAVLVVVALAPEVAALATAGAAAASSTAATGAIAGGATVVEEVGLMTIARQMLISSGLAVPAL